MAAITPATIYEEANGSNTLYILNFSVVATDTYTNAALAATTIGYWTSVTSSAAHFNASLSGNVFSLNSDTSSPGTLFVLARQM